MYFCVLRYVYRIRSLQYIHDEIFTYMSSNISPCIYSILPNYTNTSQCPRCMVTVQQMLLLNGIPISSVIRHQFLHACSFYLTNSASVFFCLHSHRKRLLNWFWEWAVWQHKAVVSVIEECDFKMLNVFLALGLNKENCPYSELKSAVLCIWFIALATRNQPKFSINQLLSRKTSFFFLMT